MKLSIGTKAVLFGVHAFWWHPITVAIAWRKLYGRWPNHLQEWLAIFVHDLGYWGKPNIDGPEGEEHPMGVSNWLFNHKLFIASYLVRFHSRKIAKRFNCDPSILSDADKASLLYDPSWFYRLRGWLSGETKEFLDRAIVRGEMGLNSDASVKEWETRYRLRITCRYKGRHIETLPHKL